MAPRPILQTVAGMQKQMDLMQAQIDFMGRMAGVEPHLARLRTTADANNPADPVPDPPSQGPSQSTEQARIPGAYDDPRAAGQTPNSVSGVPAAATDVPMTPGASIPTSPYGQLVDVSAPVAGTEGTTGAPQFGNQAGTDGVTRIETDVRALGIGEDGDQMNPTVAYPWTISPNMSNAAPPADGEMAQGSAGRAMACLRLAKARIGAGLVGGDEFAVTAALEADPAMTIARIGDELALHARYAAASAGTSGARRSDLVPRRAAARPAVPSFAGQPVTPVVGSHSGFGEEIELSDMLL